MIFYGQVNETLSGLTTLTGFGCAIVIALKEVACI